MKIPDIRLQNQQLLNPLFRKPKELVSNRFGIDGGSMEWADMVYP
ncbi:hypothetical protein [Bacteroides acidifaciens]